MLDRQRAWRNQPQPGSAQTAPPPGAPKPPVAVEAPLTPPPTEVSSPPAQVSYFYSDLAPYGTWVDLAGYGWCWQPSVVVINPGSSPYCYGGHWLFTRAGSYWQSGYSRGSGPLPYSRL